MIEIHGAGFRNKGGELMLLTAADHLRATGLVPCVEPDVDTTYETRGRYGLRALFPLVSRHRHRAYRPLLAASGVAGRVLPRRAAGRYGLVRRQDTSGLLDVSGYAFGDKFPVRKSVNFGAKARSYARRGRAVVLMPQMLGPFERAGHREAFARIASSCSLIYARERVSYGHAAEALGSEDKLRLAPDITIFSRCPPEITVERPEGRYACFVPNERMLDQGKGEWREVYAARMAAAACRCADLGVRPVIVVHDVTGGDRRLAEELVGLIGEDRCGLFTHERAYGLKAFISGASFLVGSRFHSLVAAFSTGVPGVALGWAHKYEMLASDFGQEDLLHSAGAGEGHLVGLVEELCDPARRDARSAIIAGAKSRMRAANDAMWAEIDALLGVGPGASDGRVGAVEPAGTAA